MKVAQNLHPEQNSKVILDNKTVKHKMAITTKGNSNLTIISHYRIFSTLSTFFLMLLH